MRKLGPTVPVCRHWTAELSVRGQRGFNEGQSDYGAEVTLNCRIRLPQGGRFRSWVKSFFGLSDREMVSIENYKTLSFPLAGLLSLTVRQYDLLYRVDKIRGVAVDAVGGRSELTIGLAYGVDWKRI